MFQTACKQITLIVTGEC